MRYYRPGARGLARGITTDVALTDTERAVRGAAQRALAVVFNRDSASTISWGEIVAHELETDFNQVVPGAADKGPQFLGVVQQRCNAESIGLTLHPNKPDRRQDRVVLEGTIQIQVRTFQGKGRPTSIQVFADPIGTSLNVGWQLLSDHTGEGLLSISASGRRSLDRRDRQDTNPDKLRQINAVLSAFHQVVFLPTLQQLADAVRPQPASGFFGAA